MIPRPVLKSLIDTYQKDLNQLDSIPRSLSPKLQKNFATVISGIRRCGKSTLAKQLVKGKKVYYFHFENVQLADFEQKDFAKLDDIFKEQIGKGGIYLLDEVQNIEGWEIYVRQLVDQGEVVIVTGSNATMLSKELGTRLTGRNLRYELYPFSFKEFLDLKKSKSSLKLFEDYFVQGGFPEFLKTKNRDILRNLFQDIFYRDILVKNDFRSESQLKQFVAYVSSNIGSEVSYNKLKTLLGLGSVNTVTQFVLGCESAYLFFPINKFDFSLKKQQINPKKIYCVDNGLLKLNSFSFSENKGRYLENLVFMHLKRIGKEIYYHKSKSECDFVLKEGMNIVEAIQVCWGLTDENQKREFSGLIDACKSYKLKKGLILTYDQEDSFVQDGIKIVVKPVWKWLLE
jgi:uncharacterized protein